MAPISTESSSGPDSSSGAGSSGGAPAASSGGEGAAESAGSPDSPEGARPSKRRGRRRGRKPVEEGENTEAKAGEGEGEESRPPRVVKRRGRKKREPGQGAPQGGQSNQRGNGQQGNRGNRGGRPNQQQDGRRGGGGKPRSANNALTAVRALADMAQSLLEVEGVDFLSRPRFMDVTVRVPLDPRARNDARTSADKAVEQILKRVREVREHERALVPGSVFCYFAGRADATTSRPTEPRQVFDGYGSTGRPEFTDFVTMAIERKDEGIDDLLAGEDMVLTHVTLGRVLRTQQLAEFGRESAVYKILGQVDAGLFRVMGQDRKAAFSFQLVRGTTLEGKPRLRLHPVGAIDLMDLEDAGVGQTLTRFQRKLDAESLRLAGKEAQGETVDEEEFVLPLLQELAKQLAGRARRKSRRTEHAQERTRDRDRPTAKAYDDARSAKDDALLWDDQNNTAVVIGPKGRVHVFSADARHVTSLIMQGAAIQKRRQQHRWRPAEPEERGEFRMRLDARTQAGEAVVVEGEAEELLALKSKTAAQPTDAQATSTTVSSPPASPDAAAPGSEAGVASSEASAAGESEPAPKDASPSTAAGQAGDAASDVSAAETPKDESDPAT